MSLVIKYIGQFENSDLNTILYEKILMTDKYNGVF